MEMDGCIGQFCTVKVGYHEGRKVALKIVKPKWAKQDSDAVNEMVFTATLQRICSWARHVMILAHDVLM
jgi:hypothetical protein